MRRYLAAGFGVLGLDVIVFGTFLPWLRSGRSTRNSYQAGDALERLRHMRGLLSVVITVWPYTGLACAGVLILFALGLHRAAAGFGVLAGTGTAAVSVWALGVHGSGFIAPERTGPIVTLFGALAVIGASILFLSPRFVRLPRS